MNWLLAEFFAEPALLLIKPAWVVPQMIKTKKELVNGPVASEFAVMKQRRWIFALNAMNSPVKLIPKDY